jgi:hypothetical protein
LVLTRNLEQVARAAAEGGRACDRDAALLSVIAATSADASAVAGRAGSARARSREAVFQRELDDAIVTLTDCLEVRVAAREARTALVARDDATFCGRSRNASRCVGRARWWRSIAARDHAARALRPATSIFSPQVTDDATRVVHGHGVVARARIAEGTQLWDPLASWRTCARLFHARRASLRALRSAAGDDGGDDGGAAELDVGGGCFRTTNTGGFFSLRDPDDPPLEVRNDVSHKDWFP